MLKNKKIAYHGILAILVVGLLTFRIHYETLGGESIDPTSFFDLLMLSIYLVVIWQIFAAPKAGYLFTIFLSVLGILQSMVLLETQETAAIIGLTISSLAIVYSGFLYDKFIRKVKNKEVKSSL